MAALSNAIGYHIGRQRMASFAEHGFDLHVQPRRPLCGTLRLLSPCSPRPSARSTARGSGSGHRRTRSAGLLTGRSGGLERDETLEQGVSLTLRLDQQIETLRKN